MQIVPPWELRPKCNLPARDGDTQTAHLENQDVAVNREIPLHDIKTKEKLLQFILNI